MKIGHQNVFLVPATVAGQDVKIGYHKKAHADELLGKDLIVEFGTTEFVKKFAKDGVILIGIGDGDLNDHNARKEGEDASTAMQIAKELKIVAHPAVAAVIKHVHRVDSRGGDSVYGIANVIKEFGKQNLPDEEIAKWAEMAFHAKIGELAPTKDFSLQHCAMLITAEFGEEIGAAWFMKGLSVKVEQHRDFFVSAKADFDATATVEKIASPRGELTLVVTKSDSREISRFARSRHGAGADIVINRRSSGNVSIMVSNQARIDLGDVCAALKLEEQRCRDLHESSWDKLRAPGTIDPAWDVWHFVNGVMILNGSHTATEVSPSQIPLGVIVKIVKAMLDHKKFHPKHEDTCKMGFCTGKGCPWYGIGIRRCCTIRFKGDGGDDAKLL